jgi:hypothetical protein
MDLMMAEALFFLLLDQRLESGHLYTKINMLSINPPHLGLEQSVGQSLAAINPEKSSE